jgi:1,5-anhydro-D-fructose reductase (1,5-anhydro-D-mannitol-forming)
MNDRERAVRWGFIGASTVAHEHMVNAVRLAGHEVVGLASGSRERAQQFAAEHGIAFATDSVDALLARPDVEAVYISSTNDRHCVQVLAAAAAGKHVLCEKPLAMDVAEARRMVEACRAAGVLLATNHHLRNAATHRALRDLVRAGAIGKPLFARIHHAVYLRPLVQGWRIHDPGAGGGVIRDIVVHDVDALRFVLGSEPNEAMAMTQSAYLATEGLEDGVMAVLRFADGLLAHVHAAYTTRNTVTGFEILGDQGSLVARDVMTVQPVGTITLRDGDGERPVEVAQENLYARGVSLFGAALRGQGSPAASGDDGVRSLAAALALAESARTGQRVPIAA